MATDWVVPEIDLTRCDRCGLCVEQCPAAAVDMGPTGPVIARPLDCTYCAACSEICPRQAIECWYVITFEQEPSDR